MGAIKVNGTLDLQNATRQDIYDLIEGSTPDTDMADGETLEVAADKVQAKAAVPRWEKVTVGYATIKALGYPSRSLLASWIRKAHPELPPRVGHAHEVVSSAAKQSAVMALCLRRASAQAVAQVLGVSRPSLCKWKNQLLSDEALPFMKPKQGPSPGSERDELPVAYRGRPG